MTEPIRWEEIKERFELWWRGKNPDRPLLHITARRDGSIGNIETAQSAGSLADWYLDVDAILRRFRSECSDRRFFADAYPNLSLDLGPGSMALYLGSEPEFAADTVWFKESAHDCRDLEALAYDPANRWWQTHLAMVGRAVAESRGEFLVNIPDIIENIDILASLRGPQNLIYDMIDEPDAIREAVRRIDGLYFRYYDAMYDLVKAEDGSCSYTCFQIMGAGKTAKIQCDFCALMSPGQFRDLVQPSLRQQCQGLNHSLYHLDGPDAIKHVDALMEIDELQALQWTCGAGKPDGGSDRWYPLYDKVRNAGKSLWIQIYDGGFEDWVAGVDKLVRRYGKDSLYLIFPDMTESEAERLVIHAEKHWH